MSDAALNPARYILTVSCPDKVGIVAAVAGVLADSDLFITDSHHFGDPGTRNFFMRTAFEAANPQLNRTAFASRFAPIAERFAMRWSLHDCTLRPSALIMVSKSDHCLNDLLYRHRTGSLPVHIPAIVSNHMNLAPLAEWHKIPFLYVPVTKNNKPEAEARLRDIIAETKADFIVLARYMQILSQELCAELEGRAINIHHSFLPSFKGAQPYHQAHARGVKIIGATAHYVTADLDEGPIIEQDVAHVNHAMTPRDLIRLGSDIESVVLARAVRRHVEHRILRNGHRTVVFG